MGLAMQSPRRGVRIAAPTALAILVVCMGVRLGMRLEPPRPPRSGIWESTTWFSAVKPAPSQNGWNCRTCPGEKRLATTRWRIGSTKRWCRSGARPVTIPSLRFDKGTEIFEGHQYMQTISDGRFHALELCTSGLRKHDTGIVADCMEAMGRVDEIIVAKRKALKVGD